MKSQNLSRAVRLKKDENDLRPKGLLLPFMTYSLRAIKEPGFSSWSHILYRERKKEQINSGACFKLKGGSDSHTNLKGYNYIWLF